MIGLFFLLNYFIFNIYEFYGSWDSNTSKSGWITCHLKIYTIAETIMIAIFCIYYYYITIRQHRLLPTLTSIIPRTSLHWFGTWEQR